ncbi:MAG: type II toxin-antitoxin system VapC family toxin [Myxococcales bacterium]|nr:type II toxin-antitoxin system VapC family toxin [Myxococcales bacterium]
MKYLVDTDVCIAWLKGDRRVREAWLDTQPEDVGLSSVVRAELLFGARNSQQVAGNLHRLEVFFAALQSLPFDDRAAEQYGLLRAQLTAAGRPIGPNDLMIAAAALAQDLTLVSRNDREFSRVPGLRLERW